MLMKSEEESYSLSEMIHLITGKPCDYKKLSKAAQALKEKGITIYYNPLGWNVLRLDQDCERYIRDHPDLFPEIIC